MRKIFRAILIISIPIYLFILIRVLFLRPSYRTNATLIEYIKSSSNFIPFKTIIIYIRGIILGNINKLTPIKNIVGNFLLFLPFGFYFVSIINFIGNTKKFLIITAATLILVEIIQVFTRCGIFDIDDIILNLSGAFIGYSIAKIKFRKFFS
ncbi:MAG: VanZ family protein [Clostridiales bacterium]|jgi:glycopeptide antibiotics resistance protein|nr:VanZ family protein [Clostridiales bacterium]